MVSMVTFASPFVSTLLDRLRIGNMSRSKGNPTFPPILAQSCQLIYVRIVQHVLGA